MVVVPADEHQMVDSENHSLATPNVLCFKNVEKARIHLVLKHFASNHLKYIDIVFCFVERVLITSGEFSCVVEQTDNFVGNKYFENNLPLPLCAFETKHILQRSLNIKRTRHFKTYFRLPSNKEAPPNRAHS